MNSENNNNYIYIVLKQDYDIDCYVSSEILGVYYLEQVACLALLTDAFSTDLSLIKYIHSAKHYLTENLIDYFDPYKRYSYQNIWRDTWKDKAALSRYEIQEWVLDSKFVKVEYFNFDKWFKDKVLHTFFDDDTKNQKHIREYIHNTLSNWQNVVCDEKHIPDEFEIGDWNTVWHCQKIKADFESVDRDIWLKRFGD